MAAADVAKLIASLELQDKNFTANANKAMGTLDKLSVKTVAVGTAIGIGLQQAASRGISFLVDTVNGGIDSLSQLESATSAVDGAISQVGLTGKITAKQVADWSQQIETNVGSAFDDKAILNASAILIRFGKVTPKNLEPAMQVMTDLAAKTGDVDSAAALLAKALADPAKAAGVLKRQGVILTKAQQDQIKAMLKLNDTAGAQKVLLDDLAETTKGAAAASEGPATRAAHELRDAWEDAQRALATGLLPVIEEVRGKLTTFLKDRQTITRIKAFGDALATGFQKVLDFAQKVPWAAVGNGLQKAAEWAGKLFSAFSNLPPDVQATIIALAALNKLSGGAVTSVGKGIGEAVAGALKGVGSGIASALISSLKPIPVVVVGGTGALPGGGAPGGIIAGGGGNLAGLVQKVLIVGILASVADDIQAMFGSNYDPAKILPGDQLLWPFGPKNTPKVDLGPWKNVLGGDSSLPPVPAITGSNPEDDARETNRITRQTATTASTTIAKLANFTSGLIGRNPDKTPSIAGTAKSVFVPRVTLDPGQLKDLRSGGAPSADARQGELREIRRILVQTGQYNLPGSETLAAIRGIHLNPPAVHVQVNVSTSVSVRDTLAKIRTARQFSSSGTFGRD